MTSPFSPLNFIFVLGVDENFGGDLFTKKESCHKNEPTSAIMSEYFEKFVQFLMLEPSHPACELAASFQ